MKRARDFRHEALSALTGRWGLAIGATLLYSILNGGLTGLISPNSDQLTNQIMSGGGVDFGALVPVSSLFVLILALISLAFSAIGASVQLGYNLLTLKYYEPEEKPHLGDLFCRFHIFWKAFGLRLVMGIFITLWTFLFIIPGIIASYSYAMAPYLLAENPDMGIMEAINRSKDLMRGNKWRLFCLHLSFIGWAILSIFTCGIGALFLSPYQMLADAAFYREITGKNQVTYTDANDFYYDNNTETIQ